MYKAEQEINKGLSRGARLLLGSVSGLFGVMMIFIAPPTEKAVFFHGLGISFLLISVVCFTQGRIRQFVGSLVGCALFVLSLAYLYAELTGGPWFSGSRTESSVKNALAFVLVFGVPGIAYTVKARFGLKPDS